MDVLSKIKKLENLHILFWLIKDSCWMLEFKWLGVLMIAPTLLIALFIIYHSLKTIDVYLNLAVFWWILANSFWMYSEFFRGGEYKLIAAIPFALGFLCLGIFYFKLFFTKNNTGPN